MGDFWSRAGEAWRNAPSHTPRQLEEMERAFHDAAAIATDAISSRTDAVLQQIDRGDISAEQGNAVVAALAQLRSEMESGFRRYWSPDSTR
jgi:hypothetical protein